MDTVKAKALALVDEKACRFIEANDRIWEYAETAFEEYKSMDELCGLLAANGFTIEKGVGNVATAFTASWGAAAPVIGFLGEYDALSGLSQEAGVAVKKPVEAGKPGHGCGHNCLGVASAAAAIAAKAYLEESGKPGTVIYFGCPGEEGGSGKAFMAREGVFDGIDAAITWHHGSFNAVATGPSNSNFQVLYKFAGVSAHAAADPHLGRSALDAAQLMNVGVQFLREHMIDAARIHYAIMDTGGYSPNVVQPKASVLYLIRSPKVSQVKELYERVNDVARGAALMTGTRLEIDFVKGCSNVIVNTTLEKLLYDNMAQIGVPTYTDEEKALAAQVIKSYENPGSFADMLASMVGGRLPDELMSILNEGRPLNDFLMPFFSSDIPSAGSTDVGDVSWIAPTAQICAVTTASGTPGHSWQYVACNKTSIAHKGVLFAGKVMGGAAIDLIDNPEIIDKAKAEFNKRLGGEAYICPIPKGVAPRPIGRL